MEQKRQIAACAAKLIEDGRHHYPDTGTTTLELAKCLSGKRDLTIVLNDIEIASLLEEFTRSQSNFDWRHPAPWLPLYGRPYGGILSFRAECRQSFPPHPMPFPWTAALPLLISIRLRSKTMIQVASEVIMLSDSSKFRKLSFTQFAALSDIDKLITDKGIDPQAAEQLRQLESFDLVIA